MNIDLNLNGASPLLFHIAASLFGQNKKIGEIFGENYIR
jgi:hypothetical protein